MNAAANIEDVKIETKLPVLVKAVIAMMTCAVVASSSYLLLQWRVGVLSERIDHLSEVVATQGKLYWTKPMMQSYATSAAWANPGRHVPNPDDIAEGNRVRYIYMDSASGELTITQ